MASKVIRSDDDNLNVRILLLVKSSDWRIKVLRKYECQIYIPGTLQNLPIPLIDNIA